MKYELICDVYFEGKKHSAMREERERERERDGKQLYVIGTHPVYTSRSLFVLNIEVLFKNRVLYHNLNIILKNSNVTFKMHFRSPIWVIPS
jgi:hypothetical protein